MEEHAPEPGSTTAPPRPRPFPVLSEQEEEGTPGLRCGHTLTAIAPEKNPAAAKLVMFGTPDLVVTEHRPDPVQRRV